jgi:anti-sigma factor RsiW
VNARIVSLDSDEHLALQALLPWYANGTLARAEAARVEAHLQQCARCRADLEWQSRLRALTSLADTLGARDDRDDRDVADRRWSALRARLDADAAEAAGRRPAFAAPRRPARWLPWAFGLQTAFVLGLAVFVGWSALVPREPYRVLGAAQTGAVAANALVVFRPDATEQQMRHALRAGDARIVGGPTATDAYLLQIGAAANIADAVARLRIQPGVLRVESLEAAGPR